MNRNALAGVITVVVCGLAACTPATSSPTPAVSTSPPTNASPSSSLSPSPSLGPTEAVIMATLTGYYKGLDYLKNNPEVLKMYHATQWTTGEALAIAINDVMSIRENLTKAEGDTIIREVKIGAPAQVDGVDTSITTYCADATKVTLITKSGERKPAVIPTLQTTATIVLEKGEWKISMIRTQDGPC